VRVCVCERERERERGERERERGRGRERPVCLRVRAVLAFVGQRHAQVGGARCSSTVSQQL
jgi:hypothetical protein